MEGGKGESLRFRGARYGSEASFRRLEEMMGPWIPTKPGGWTGVKDDFRVSGFGTKIGGGGGWKLLADCERACEKERSWSSVVAPSYASQLG
jgi:hypothetical protein